MIEDLYESAKDELKRADHSIYVSLKYARTIDIIKNTIKRLLSAFDISILEALEYAKAKKKISLTPQNARLRAETASKLFPKLKKDISFYFLLKDIDRAEYSKKEEYRKNVALLAKVNTKVVEVNIERLREYFDRTVEFVDFVNNTIVKGK